MNAPATEDAAVRPAPRRPYDPHRLSNPQVFLLSMIIFVVIVAFLAAILSRQLGSAFMTNPGLNGLIFGVLAVGIVLAFQQVTRLFREVTWVNSFKDGDTVKAGRREPVLLAPMKALLAGRQSVALNTASMRSILDSIGTRLDESRDIVRYMIGLLVFLGLLGTFWGLLQTIGSIGSTIQSLDPGTGDTNDILDSLKTGLSAPLDGMGTAFSSSLFGLSGSLVLGFLDLQAGRAQNRFYTELENWLSSVTRVDDSTGLAQPLPAAVDADQLTALTEQIAQMQDGASNPRQAQALASLADGVHGLVKSMRSEQQMMREWVDAQAQDQKATRQTLERLAELLDRLNDRRS